MSDYTDGKAPGAMVWFSAGVVSIAVMVGIVGAVMPNEDNRVIVNSYNNNTNALIAVTNNVDMPINSDLSTTTNTDVSGQGNTVSVDHPDKTDEFGNTTCWDPDSKMYTFGACAKRSQP